MTFTQAIQSVFSQYATFSGRARRSEYWFFVLFNYVISAALGFLGRYMFLFSILSGLYSLAVLIPSLAVTWRRLHDIGKGGGWYFFILVPLVGWIFLLVWLCRDSQPGQNAYGPNPKEPFYEDNSYNSPYGNQW